MWNYPLCFTIPCTQYIHLFSFTKRHIIAKIKNLANANFAKNLLTNTLIGVPIITLTFTLDALFLRSPWKLKSMITHWPLFGCRSCSLATFVAKRVTMCPICVSGFWIHRSCASLSHNVKIVCHNHPSTSFILFKSINSTPHFVISMFRTWTQTIWTLPFL